LAPAPPLDDGEEPPAPSGSPGGTCELEHADRAIATTTATDSRSLLFIDDDVLRAPARRRRNDTRRPEPRRDARCEFRSRASFALVVQGSKRRSGVAPTRTLTGRRGTQPTRHRGPAAE